MLLLASLGLVACQTGSDDAEQNGEVVIGLTDAEGDFASYSVDVLSLTLTKANGAVVETLPMSTRVDFAQYTDLTEFLTAATVPNGVYVKASMVLDYNNADIWVENAIGDGVQVAAISDGNGNSLTQLEVSVQLEGRNRLLIAPGLPSHMTLDFDLKASNSVSFDDQGVPSLVVEPLLLADVELTAPKVHRLRGPLAEVDVAGDSFEVILRPFHHVLNNDHRRHFGALHVVSNSETLFEIDGESYQGNAGLVALDAKPTFTAVVVVGDLKFHPRRFEAREVYAGSSVPGGVQDVVTGNVIARTGDSLTVKGATLIRAGGSVIFNDEITVDLGDMTTVKRQLDLSNGYDINDISVGQRVRIFGTLTNDMANQLQIDAGVSHQGWVQMRFTTLRGTVVGVVGIPEQPLPFVIDLQAIDGRRVSLFDFAGTGNAPASDADPTFYEIDAGNLDVSGLADGTPVKVRGFVRPFGQAPMDFTAHTVVDVAQLPGLMAVNWQPASNTALSSVTSEGLDVNLDGVGLFHHLVRGRVAVDLTDEAVTPRIEPKDPSSGQFWIAQSGSYQLHTDFASFAADLETRLATGALVKHLGATGLYADNSGLLSAGFVIISLE